MTIEDIRLEFLPERIKQTLIAQRAHDEVSVAAAQLAKLSHESRSRPRRVYTGRVGRKRGWRGMKVVLANGQIGELVTALRGAAFVSWRDEFAINPDKLTAVWVADLKRFKLPAAVALGARKRGSSEKPSAKKAVAARLNGCRPARPGSRPRGRPRRGVDLATHGSPQG